MRNTTTALMVLGVIAFAACGDDPADADPETLELSFTGLDPLGNGFHYEGWAIIDGSPVTTGKFNVDTNGGLVDTNGSAIVGGAFDTGFDLTDASAIVITIEPAGDTDAVPADTHVPGGTGLRCLGRPFGGPRLRARRRFHGRFGILHPCHTDQR